MDRFLTLSDRYKKPLFLTGLCMLTILINLKIERSELILYCLLFFIVLFKSKDLYLISLFSLSSFLCSTLLKILKIDFFLPANSLILPLFLSFLLTRGELLRFKIERPKKEVLFLMVCLIFFSSFFLILWNKLFAIQSSFFQSFNSLQIFIFIASFAVLNALIEEISFRGFIQEILVANFKDFKTFGFYLAIFLQGIWFGAIHFQNGFPRFFSGFILASIYGIALGFLKEKTQNLFFCVITHIFADLTIGLLLLKNF